MEEFRLSEHYHPMAFSWQDNWSKDDNDPLIGHLTSSRCPQCGARLLKNPNGDEWCWNCDFKNSKKENL